MVIMPTSSEGSRNAISCATIPKLSFKFDEDVIDGKRVVVLTIPAARVYPTAYNGERYIRIGSSKEELRRFPEREAALFQILNEKNAPTDKWEIQISKYHVGDINRKAFDDYLKKAKDAGRLAIDSDEPEAVLNSIDVADGDVLLNAGAAVFVDSGMNEVQISRFPTDERLTILDTKRYTGCILVLADKVVLYISDAMDWRAEFDGSVSRKEIPEIPVEAIREAVINAFAHREIESRQAVDISIYKSFIDIYSPGLFPQNLEPEAFIHRTIKPPRRNPLITKTLYYSKNMEAVATGFKRINAECAKAGVKYEFIKEEYGFTVRFHRHCGEGWNQSPSQSLSEEGTKKGTEKGTENKKSDEIEIRIERVYELIKNNPTIAQKTIASQLGISLKQAKDATEALKQTGRLHREGSSNGGKWVID